MRRLTAAARDGGQVRIGKCVGASTAAAGEPQTLGSRMSSREQRAKEIQRAIGDVLLRNWDPLGVKDVPQGRTNTMPMSAASTVWSLLVRRPSK